MSNRQAAKPGGKRSTAAEALRPWLSDGMRIGLGGFGLDRKPMALVAEIAASPVGHLIVETYAGGLDVELLLAAGRLAQVNACHVGLDHFGLAPLFRKARQEATIRFEEWSEWTQLAAWRAAAEKAPYAVVPLDPATDLIRVNPNIEPAPRLFGSPPAFAVRASEFDLALLHVEAIHPDGWAVAEGDPYLDTMLARAAKHVVVSAERLMDDTELERRHRDVHLLANTVDVIVVAPGGALPGSCLPEYMIDPASLRRYIEAASAGVDANELGRIIRSALPRRAEKVTANPGDKQ